MYNLIIYRSTQGTGEGITILIWKTFKSRNSSIISNKLFGHLVKFLSCHTGFYQFSNFSQSPTYKQVTLTKQLYLIICLKKYHLRLINMQQHYQHAP